MNLKRSLQNRIRGWFPQEPKLPNKTSPNPQSKTHKPLPKPLFRITSFLATYIAVISLLFFFSTVQTILLVAMAAFGTLWFVSNRQHRVSARRFLRKCTILLLVVVIVFCGAQFFVFETSGFPATSVPHFSYSNVANVSLVQYLHSVEDSQNFQLLQVNHFGTVTFERLEIHAYNEGWLTWTFRCTDTNSKVTIGNTAGNPYYTSLGSMMDSLFPVRALPPKDYALQSVAEAFRQIDQVGFNFYLNQALEHYSIRPSPLLDIVALNVYLGFDDVGIYQGLTVFFQARGLDLDSSGTAVYPGLFEAEFAPDGTLLYYKTLV